MTASAPTIEPPVSSAPRAGPAVPSPVIDSPEARDALDCPLCGYSLRGLSATSEEPRCPECGYSFSWPELLAARQHLHPFLFEHRPSAGSFVRTLRAAARPRRFWASLNAGHVLHVRRLLVYTLLVQLLLVPTALASYYAVKVMEIHERNWSTNWQFQGRRRAGFAPPPRPGIFQEAWAVTFTLNGPQAYLLAGALAWPWTTLGSLTVFQASMRRARVRMAHVLRCVAYSSAALLWIGVLLPLVGALRVFGLLPRDHYIFGSNWVVPPIATWQAISCILLVASIAAYRLAIAYARYLRFEHAGSTVLASQIVALLLTATVTSLFYPAFIYLFM